jgi:hypothetical protein
VLVTSYLDRGEDTMGWKISKFHELLHLAMDMMNFGSCSNVDSGKGEHGLIYWGKLASKTVRRRGDTDYLKDMGTRVYENRVLELAMDTLVQKPTAAIEEDPGTDIILSYPLFELGSGNEIGDNASDIRKESVKFLKKLQGLPPKVQIYKTARFQENGNVVSVGDWASVRYVKVNRRTRKETLVFYPMELMGFFTSGEGSGEKKKAVGRMGSRCKMLGNLLLKWTLEEKLRVVDLDIFGEPLFVLSVPEICCYPAGADVGLERDHVLVIRDRIQEWPSIFDKGNWKAKSMRGGGTKRGSSSFGKSGHKAKKRKKK